MKKILFFILLSAGCFTVYAQPTFKYCNPKHFKGYSIAFTKEYKANISIQEFKGQFTPTKENIDSAEAIFIQRYEADINQKEAYIMTHDPVKFYRYYKRQYMGLIAQNGDKLILMQMLNVPKPRKKNLEDYYENWENVYILGTGDFYERNTVPFIVNLTTGELRVY